MRRGITLIEVLLSVAVLGSLAAILLPPMAMLLDDQRLRRAGDLVQISLDSLRLDAMRNGHVITVSGLADSDRLAVQSGRTPGDDSDRGLGMSALAAGADQAAITADIADVSPSISRDVELPPGVRLAGISVGGSMRDQLAGNEARLFSAASPLENSPSNLPSIYLYPDGSTSDAWIDLRSDDGDSMRVRLRGITGRSDVIEISGS